MLALNSLSYYLSLPRAGITGVSHHIWLVLWCWCFSFWYSQIFIKCTKYPRVSALHHYDTWGRQCSIKKDSLFCLTFLVVSLHGWLGPLLWASVGTSWWGHWVGHNCSPHSWEVKEKRGLSWHPLQEYSPNDMRLHPLPVVPNWGPSLYQMDH
jgi:hypothetical protein